MFSKLSLMCDIHCELSFKPFLDPTGQGLQKMHSLIKGSLMLSMLHAEKIRGSLGMRLKDACFVTNFCLFIYYSTDV